MSISLSNLPPCGVPFGFLLRFDTSIAISTIVVMPRPCVPEIRNVPGAVRSAPGTFPSPIGLWRHLSSGDVFLRRRTTHPAMSKPSVTTPANAPARATS